MIQFHSKIAYFHIGTQDLNNFHQGLNKHQSSLLHHQYLHKKKAYFHEDNLQEHDPLVKFTKEFSDDFRRI